MRYCTQLCHRYQHAVEVLGKRWTCLIVKVLFEGPLRFNELAERLDRVVSDRMLSERLKELEAEGIVVRHVYPETPVRVEYRLTAKGEALAPVVDAIHAWGDRWVEEPR
jgi:DNA-binding HxlR family transcriptional regulator